MVWVRLYLIQGIIDSLTHSTMMAMSVSIAETVDEIISPRWLIPVVPQGLVLTEHSVAIKNGRILAVVPDQDLAHKYRSERHTKLTGHALIPGLVNAHTHAAMTVLRGFADDLHLDTWLNDHIWPAEARHMDRDFVTDGSRLAIAEMLRGGITCFNDMYFFADQTAHIAIQMGMRACIGLIVLDFPTVWGRDPLEYMDKAVQIHDKFLSEPLVHTAFAPHAPYTVAGDVLRQIGVYAEEMDVQIHMHVHETDKEIADSLSQHGRRPLAYLKDLGLLSNRLAAVHLTHLNDEDLELLGTYGVHAVHCPQSNLKLGSGICPIKAVLDAGINLAIGTDGAASNNSLDMLAETRMAALLAKGTSLDATVLPAVQALYCATQGGAQALGLGSEIGSIEAGKSADLAAIHLEQIATLPVFHPISALIYAANRHQFTDTWVAGRRVLAAGELPDIDKQALCNSAHHWQNRINDGY